MPVISLISSGSGSNSGLYSGSGSNSGYGSGSGSSLDLGLEEEERKGRDIYGIILLIILCFPFLVVVCCYCRLCYECCIKDCCSSIYNGILNKCKLVKSLICGIIKPVVPIEKEFSKMVILDIIVPQDSKFNDMCPICLVEVCDSDKPIGLKCGHMYHDSCIIPWFKSQIDNGKNATCPLCKMNIRVHVPKIDKCVNYDSDSSYGDD